MNTVLHSLAYGLDFLRTQVADVSPADMVRQPAGLPNHPAWVIGHLTLTCQQVAEVLGLPPWLAHHYAGRYGTGSRPVADPSAYEAKTEALAALADAQARLTDVVSTLDRRRLDEPFPDPAYAEAFPSIGHFLTQVLAGHTAYHVGQVGAWRKALGLPPLTRSFE